MDYAYSQRMLMCPVASPCIWFLRSQLVMCSSQLCINGAFARKNPERFSDLVTVA